MLGVEYIYVHICIVTQLLHSIILLEFVIQEALYIFDSSIFTGDKKFEYHNYTHLRNRNFGHRKLTLLDF